MLPLARVKECSPWNVSKTERAKGRIPCGKDCGSPRKALPTGVSDSDPSRATNHAAAPTMPRHQRGSRARPVSGNVPVPRDPRGNVPAWDFGPCAFGALAPFPPLFKAGVATQRWIRFEPEIRARQSGHGFRARSVLGPRLRIPALRALLGSRLGNRPPASCLGASKGHLNTAPAALVRRHEEPQINPKRRQDGPVGRGHDDEIRPKRRKKRKGRRAHPCRQTRACSGRSRRRSPCLSRRLDWPPPPRGRGSRRCAAPAAAASHCRPPSRPGGRASESARGAAGPPGRTCARCPPWAAPTSPKRRPTKRCARRRRGVASWSGRGRLA
mmetsp:Transcript_24659/g.84411  ORF Transcript_24659/g.84411 Transcript_24659/m.84411 type:complete len:327 (+) Transcript_24659:202-1182(+)